ncbi:hypothetical protein L3Q67_19230 [Saccharothrix sp. AJ9571]|nr:hypothetical protein L3Q67_19230 [Saccharothrix sp. AJ9571]
MVEYQIGRPLSRELRSRHAAALRTERSARIRAWLAGHRAAAMLVAATLAALAGWGLAAARDGANTQDLVFWELILVPAAVLATWVFLARIRRRGSV